MDVNITEVIPSMADILPTYPAVLSFALFGFTTITSLGFTIWYGPLKKFAEVRFIRAVVCTPSMLS